MKPNFRQQKIKVSSLRKIIREEVWNIPFGSPYFWDLPLKSPILKKWKKRLKDELDINVDLIDELYTFEVVSLDERHLLHKERTDAGKKNLLLKFLDDKGESALLLFIAVLCDDSNPEINVRLGRLLEDEGHYVLD